jgi:hypothetical protein
MSDYGFLFKYLWIAPHIFQAVLCVLLVRRKLVADHPAFFSYSVWECFQFVLLLALYRYRGISDDQYMEIYLAGACVSSLLRFTVVYEVFRRLFRDYAVLTAFGRVLYRSSVVTLILASVILVAWTTRDTHNHVAIWVNVIDRMVSIVQCGLLVVLFATSRMLGFSWRNLSFGIALGLGLFASVQLAVVAIRAAYGPATQIVFLNYLTMATYHVCVLVWLFYASVPERYAHFEPRALRDNALQDWNLALKRIIER